MSSLLATAAGNTPWLGRFHKARGRIAFTAGNPIIGAVFEDVSLLARKQPCTLQVVEVRLEANLPQGDHHLYIFQSLQLAIEKMRAFDKFLRKRLVVRWSTAHGSRNV